MSLLLREKSPGKMHVLKHHVSLQVVVDGFVHVWFIYLWVSFCTDFSSLANSLVSGGVSSEVGFWDQLLSSQSL